MKTMATVHYLSDDVIAHIAAGEVIERPVYVVKELIDNALDAQATSIFIDISNAGLKRISVLDDGIGMSEADIKLATKLHTTSKISDLEDLEKINFLGFRGEALASIAAVSDLVIYSRRQKDPVGYMFVACDSSTLSSGMPVGTRVVVENLFASVPARKNFLRSIQTERRLIIDLVSSYALAHPHVHFILRQDSKVIFDLPTSSILERYAALFGEFDPNLFLPLELDDAYLKLRGFIGKPNRAFSSTHEQYLSINNRPITDKLLSSAIKEAYGTLLPRDQYPSAIISLTIPIELVDVNVHPRKEYVTFANPQHLFDTLKSAIQDTLQAHNLTFQATGTNLITRSFAGTLLKEQVLGRENEKPAFLFATVMQWHATYMSVETNIGVLLFDQHAVHERILYEQFLAEFLQQRKKSLVHVLKEPMPVPVSRGDAAIIEEYQDYLSDLGFMMTANKNGCVLTSLPKLFSDRDPVPIIQEFIADVRNGLSIRSIDSLTHRLLTYLACRSAVKAGDKLTKKRMQELIEELQSCQNKYTCPHGRPTMIEVKKKDLDVLFKRS